MRSWLRERLANFVFSHLFNGVVPSDFLAADSRNRLTRRGVALTDAQTRGIISEAKGLLSSELLRMVIDEMRASAQMRAFAAPTTDEGMHAKATLFALDVLTAKLRALASRTPAPPNRT